MQQNPFDILGSQTNSLGYNYTVCVECTIKSMNNDFYKFKTYSFNISSSPDCSKALIPKPILNDYDLNYDKNGKIIDIGYGYQTFFVHANKNICKVNKCSLMTEGCKEVSLDKNVTINVKSPF